MKHLPALDGLRAIAVLAVVAYHAGLPVPAGFVGVDVFFVISGYVITRLLADEIAAEGRIDFLHFYARRARRILPAAVLVVAVTLALAFALLPSGRAEVAQSAAAAAAFVANFHFQSVTGGYWSASSEQMPLLHLWSLSVEEQFYLLWPLLLVAVRRRPVAWLVAVAVASFALAEWLIWFDPTAAFYQMPARAWELALGGLVALSPLTLPRWSAGVGLLVVLASCFVPLPHFPGIGALPAVAGAALLIAAIHNGASVRVLELRPVVYVGLISYSLYLWHWPLLALDRAMRAGDAPLAVRLALCAAAFLLAAMSYRYVEQPFRRSRMRSGRAVAAGLACVSVLYCAAFALAAKSPTASREAVMASVMASDRQCHPFGHGIPALTQAPKCVATDRKVVIWGDSHAFAWEPMAEAIASREGIAAAVFWESSCYPTIGVAIPYGTDRAIARCVKINADTLAYLKTNGADTLILSAYWTRLFGDHPDIGRSGVLNLVREAAPSVRRILVIGPTPTMRDDVERCIAIKADCSVPRAEFEAAATSARSVMAELAKLPKVEIIDPSDWLCDTTTCPDVRDGAALYWDIHHVSRPVAEAFSAHWSNHDNRLD